MGSHWPPTNQGEYMYWGPYDPRHWTNFCSFLGWKWWEAIHSGKHFQVLTPGISGSDRFRLPDIPPPGQWALLNLVGILQPPGPKMTRISFIFWGESAMRLFHPGEAIWSAQTGGWSTSTFLNAWQRHAGFYQENRQEQEAPVICVLKMDLGGKDLKYRASGTRLTSLVLIKKLRSSGKKSSITWGERNREG